MSTQTPTQITIVLNPGNEEHALYLIREAFTSTTFTVADAWEEQVELGTLFVLKHRDKRLTLALSAPATVKQIEEIAYLVATGLILGFVVRGELDLDGRVVNNLAK